MVTSNGASQARAIHDALHHPIIDADGHWLEAIPVFLEYLSEIGGSNSVEAFLRYWKNRWSGWYENPTAELLLTRRARASWWVFPADTLDRATEMMPSLLCERLDEFGFDFALVYPTLGLGIHTIADPDLRASVVRALNTMAAEMFAPYSDRMTPVATLSAFTPGEAQDELEFCVNELHLKTAWLHGALRRPLPTAGSAIDGAQGATFVDNLVLDNTLNYDQLWRKFVDLKVAVATHAGSMGWGDRSSPSNYCFNHMGHFAQANHFFARALFLSGVTYRFPTLNFAFLEGGCGWAMNLYHDLVGHWQKRSRKPLLRDFDPRNLETERLVELFEEYGGRWFAGRTHEMLNDLDPYYPSLSPGQLFDQEQQHELDDFAAAHIGSVEELRERFATNFYFGCEADDPMTVWANDPRMLARLKPIFSSDIGHFDVPHMNMVLPEAYELVEHGQLSEDEFRAFTFSNAVELYTKMNPVFFDGTAIESQVNIERARSHEKWNA